jgi:DNA polymerase
MIIIFDYETRSEADIKEVGAWEYSTHPSTEVICVAWVEGTLNRDGKIIEGSKGVQSINFLQDDTEEFFWLLKRKDAHFVAHNFFFEYAITKNVLGIELDFKRAECTAARAAALALPRHLVGACQALKLPFQKDMEGHKLMLKMCKPRRATKTSNAKWHESAEDVKRLIEYCEADIMAEVSLYNSTPPLSPKEKLVWELDQKMNSRGVKVDRDLVLNSKELIEEELENLKDETVKLTGGVVDSLTRRDAILKFIRSRGVELPDLTAKTVKDTLPTVTDPISKRLLEIRQAVGKTSTAKYDAFEARSRSDGKLRDLLVYHGASTGRWSGSGVQLQNLPRGSVKNTDQSCRDVVRFNDIEILRLFYINPMDVFSSNLRGCLLPNENKKFFCGDYAAIEVRVLFWLAGHDAGLGAYIENRDLYREMATRIYNVDLDKVTKDQREVAKRAVLGAGYGMGPKKFGETCRLFGIDVNDDLAVKAVGAYRETHFPVVNLWRDLNRGAIQAAQNPMTVIKSGKIKWLVKHGFLWCLLPSGRRLAYYQPEVRYEPTPWGDKHPRLYYQAVNSITKQWGSEATYGGKLTENLVQAIARDLMADAMLRLENKNYEVKLSVHDELLTEASGGDLNQFLKLMGEVPEWAMGLPVKVEGWSSGERYRK